MLKYTGWVTSRFTVVSMENNIVINSVLPAYNYKPTFTPP